jgi:hypothetical protein
MMKKIKHIFSAVKRAVSQYSGLVFIRASGPEDQRNAVRTLEGTIIGGAIMFLAKPVAYWLTGINVSSNSTLPTALVTMVNNLLTLLQYIGAVVLIAGFIYGGIKWKKARSKNN